MPISITDEDIELTEKILFSNESDHFDESRKAFIKNLSPFDLHAAPGSGKTTALLSKLLILDKHFPMEKNAGILVLSHTNAAIEEIRNRISRYCNEIFNYPSFVGTIQSFVDYFFALPFFESMFNNKVTAIDNGTYRDLLENYLKRCLTGESYDVFLKVKYIVNSNPSILEQCRFGLDSDNDIIILKAMDEGQLIIKKPLGRTRNYVDYTDTEKTSIINYILKIKRVILKKGYLCFDDAYFLANLYIAKFPQIIDIVRKRFKYVFIDEMQDMQGFQIQIIDKLFNSNDVSLQKIGDVNQSIFSMKNIGNVVWILSERNQMTIKGSRRFSNSIANIVKALGIYYVDIEGNADVASLKPVIILFDDETIKNVIPHFAKMIKKYQDEGSIPFDNKYPFYSIGFRKQSSDISKLSLINYFEDYKGAPSQEKTELEFLSEYLTYYDLNEIEGRGLRVLLKSLQDSLIHLLKKEEIKDVRGNKYLQKSLNEYLKSKDNEYELYINTMYGVCLNILKNEIETAISYWKTFVIDLLKRVFPSQKISSETMNFITGSGSTPSPAIISTNQSNKNVYICPDTGIEVQIGTVHSVKGSTHHSTLYLETFYQRKYESERFITQLEGQRFLQEPSGLYDNQVARVTYVGFSRPKYLLAFAAHKDRVIGHEEKLIENGWEIDDELIQAATT